MKRILAALAVLILAAAGLTPTAAIATASTAEVLIAVSAPAVQIQTVRYNVKGVDTPSNARYEYVVIRNVSADSGQDMTGWTLEDAVGNTFTFPGSTAAPWILAPGAWVVVHTGRNLQPSADITATINLYWGRYNHVWSNSGKDSVVLYTAAGVRVDRFSYDDFTFTP
ncbi:hypothetical protein Aph01nite_13030 [Acrocarpospora phusangensis]|uniref:LTD domain-containing protein n=1 Tax=Acrocarpospora phusangensis TaxID=1070424 RepID=A0A919Q8U7_9ACTN|nr:lamin tail domain-containing protein [Acrocarpospora phusangensis]GIH22993.1 hypothetical protein Aph01nite_13030 [Acrocarpospora phusangensis]